MRKLCTPTSQRLRVHPNAAFRRQTATVVARSSGSRYLTREERREKREERRETLSRQSPTPRLAPTISRRRATPPRLTSRAAPRGEERQERHSPGKVQRPDPTPSPRLASSPPARHAVRPRPPAHDAEHGHRASLGGQRAPVTRPPRGADPQADSTGHRAHEWTFTATIRPGLATFFDCQANSRQVGSASFFSDGSAFPHPVVRESPLSFLSLREQHKAGAGRPPAGKSSRRAGRRSMWARNSRPPTPDPWRRIQPLTRHSPGSLHAAYWHLLAAARVV